MKRVSCVNSFILAAVSSLFISGCKKVYDYIETHPGAEIRPCGIHQFIYQPLYSETMDTLTFTYNVLGDPVKAIRPEPRTGAPNYLFRYKNGRLSEFIGVYSNGVSTERWHRYFYDAAGRVMIDSVYIFADIVNGHPSNAYDSSVITFIYDSKNRITQEKNTFSGGYTYIQDYQYNADGNKVGYTYNQGVSFRRSNKIWMFLDRDYSVNDRTGSGNYNSFHMPTTIELGSGSIDIFLDNYFNSAQIRYLCGNNSW